MDQRRIDKMFRQEPALQFIGADDVGNDYVVGAIIPQSLCLGGSLMCVDEDKLMGFEQARQHGWYLLAAIRRSGNARQLGHVARIADRDAAKRLDALGHGIYQSQLFTGVFVQQQVQLIKAPRMSQWCFL